MQFTTAYQVPPELLERGDPLRIYTGTLGQIGDIVMFTATVRRLKELFPRSEVTFAVSSRYRAAGELVAGLPYVDRLFVTEIYFEKLTPSLQGSWDLGFPVNLRGDDEIEEQRRHDIVLETRPRHARVDWWSERHQVEEAAFIAGVPGPIDLRTEISIPKSALSVPRSAIGKIVLHNDPAISEEKSWPWEHVTAFAQLVGASEVALLGHPGPEVLGCLDLRGRTTLAEAAAVIAACRCYVGIDSGLMWIAGSLQVPAVGLYGTSYIPAYGAIQPSNPRAVYLQAEGSPAAIPPQAVAEWCRRKLEGG